MPQTDISDSTPVGNRKPPSAVAASLASTLGILSIPLGVLLGFLAGILVAVPATILGSIALRHIYQGMAIGRKCALTGVITGVIGITIPLVVMLFFPAP